MCFLFSMIRSRKKLALFLSIETVGVIIIITAISALIIAGIAHLFKMYKVYQISSDISKFSEAVINFKITYKFFPGDLPKSKLTGSLASSVFNQAAETSLMNGITGTAAVSPSCPGSETITPGTPPTCSGGGTYSAGSSAVSAIASLPQGRILRQAGAVFAFRQLALAKLISFPINVTKNTTKVKAAADCGPFHDFAVTDKILPLASWDDALAWTIGSDTESPKASIIQLDSALVKLWGSSRPRLILFRHGALTTDADCVIDLTVADKSIGSLSPNIATEVTMKLSDGLPSSTKSTIIIENYQNDNSCTSLPSGKTAAADRFLNSSNDDSGENGCVLSAGIEGSSD